MTDELAVYADQAKQNEDSIILVKADIEGSFLILADLLCDNRDWSLWKCLNYDSFEAFLGQPDIGIRRSTAYGLMKIRDLYIKKLGINPELLKEVGSTKLLKMSPVIEKEDNKEKIYEWIGNAKAWSKSDLQLEVATVLGSSLHKPPIIKAETVAISLDSCINGCSAPAEKSHFPCTRGASTPDDWWIPMCHKCHMEFHANPSGWTWMYRKNWARWFYSQIRRG